MIGIRSLVETTRAADWARTLDVRIKIAMLLSAAMLVVLVDSPATLVGLCILAAALHPASRLPWPKVRLAAGIALLTVWGTMLGQAVFYASVPRTPVFVLIPKDAAFLGPLTGGMAVYFEGLVYGAVQSMRIVTMVALGLWVVWTTDPGDFLTALVRLRVPYGIAFMTVTALRFLPTVAAEAAVVRSARRMRGYHLRRGTWLHPARELARFMKPLFANAVRRSRVVALSVESRAFDPAAQRTRRTVSTLGAVGRVFLVALLAALAAVIALKTLNGLFLHDVYYSSSLGGVYEFVQAWL